MADHSRIHSAAAGDPRPRAAERARRYQPVAASTCISTSMLGRAISACTVARTGLFSASTHAFHTSFIDLKSEPMSLSQIVACAAVGQI